MAQLVEYDLAKVGVAGSNPVCRFRNTLWKSGIAKSVIKLKKYLDKYYLCIYLNTFFYFREQRAKRACLHAQLAAAVTQREGQSQTTSRTGG